MFKQLINQLFADIRTFVQDLNPTQLATIDSEFEKVAGQEPPKSLRASVCAKLGIYL